MQMYTAKHQNECRAPNVEIRARIEAAVGVCHPIGLQQYQPLRLPNAPRDKATNQRVHMGRGTHGSSWICSRGLHNGYLWEGNALVLWRFDDPG